MSCTWLVIFQNSLGQARYVYLGAIHCFDFAWIPLLQHLPAPPDPFEVFSKLQKRKWPNPDWLLAAIEDAVEKKLGGSGCLARRVRNEYLYLAREPYSISAQFGKSLKLRCKVYRLRTYFSTRAFAIRQHIFALDGS